MDVADLGPSGLAGTMRTPLFHRAVGVAVLACVVFAGCSDNGSARPGGSDASSTTTSVDSSVPADEPSTTSAADVAVSIRAAYDAAASGFIEASKTSDPDHPLLAATHTGPMLEQRRLVLTGRRRDGRASRQPPGSVYRIEHEKLEMVDATSARLTVCVVDDGVVYEVASGVVVNDRVETGRANAVMRLEDGVWKLAERELVEEWPGVAGCAVD